MQPTFTATIEHVNQTTSKATVRTHTILVDRSVAKGGFDSERGVNVTPSRVAA